MTPAGPTSAPAALRTRAMPMRHRNWGERKKHRANKRSRTDRRSGLLARVLRRYWLGHSFFISPCHHPHGACLPPVHGLQAMAQGHAVSARCSEHRLMRPAASSALQYRRMSRPANRLSDLPCARMPSHIRRDSIAPPPRPKKSRTSSGRREIR